MNVRVDESELAAERAIRKDYQSVFDNPIGARVLADLREKCHLEGTVFDPSNDRVTAYRCGERDVVRYILEMLKGIDNA